MRLKPLLIGTLTTLLLGVGAAWSISSNGDNWVWNLAPKLSGYVPDRNDINFYYPLPEVVEITSPFGYRIHPIYGDRRLHSGVDLGAPAEMPVLSAHAGYVRYADWGDGYGKMIIVEYADGQYQTLYAHLSEILVKEGDAVRPRQVIGKVGSTGGVRGAHLHFELLRKAGEDFTAIDPISQVKAVEAYVAVKPPDAIAPDASQNQTPPSQPWNAPALDGTTQPPIAAAPTALPINPANPDKATQAATQNIILEFK